MLTSMILSFAMSVSPANDDGATTQHENQLLEQNHKVTIRTGIRDRRGIRINDELDSVDSTRTGIRDRRGIRINNAATADVELAGIRDRRGIRI